MNENRRSGTDPYTNLARGVPPTESSRTPIILGAVAIVVVIAALVAIIASNLDNAGSDIQAVQEIGPIEVTGDPLPEYPQNEQLAVGAGADPAVGMTPPRLDGVTFEADPFTLDPGDGRAKVVVFATHWCPVCQREVPRIREWLDGDNLPDDVDLQLINTSVRADGSAYPPSRWLSRVGWSEPVLLDNIDGDAGRSWGLRSYPYLVFLDADGTVRTRVAGELPTEELDRLVNELSST